MFMFVLQIANGQDENEVILDDLPTKLTGLTEVTTDYVFSEIVVGFHFMNRTSNWESPENNSHLMWNQKGTRVVKTGKIETDYERLNLDNKRASRDLASSLSSSE